MYFGTGAKVTSVKYIFVEVQFRDGTCDYFLRITIFVAEKSNANLKKKFQCKYSISNDDLVKKSLEKLKTDNNLFTDEEVSNVENWVLKVILKFSHFYTIHNNTIGCWFL